MNEFDPTWTPENSRYEERERVRQLTIVNYDHIMSQVKVATIAEQKAIVAHQPKTFEALSKSADHISGMEALAAETKKLQTDEIKAMMDALTAELQARQSPTMKDTAERLSKALSVGYEGIQKASEHKEVLRIEGLQPTVTLGGVPIMIPGKYEPNIVISGLSITDMVELNCPHDPNDTGFGFAYCRMCNAKMRRGKNLEWQVDRKA
jgi:hypothetical protein